MNKLAVDSTQTLRALSLPESQDTSQARWFVVQLVLSDRPINLDMMPRLEVFDSYRLYTVAGRQDGSSVHALRLGFFSDDVSATTLCGYLQTFFASPSVVRVSAAEHDRFLSPAAAAKSHKTAPSSNARVAAQPAVAQPIERNAAPPAKGVTKPHGARTTGTQKVVSRTKSLGEQLLDEAREVQAARSGRHRIPQRSGSWITRLLGSKS